nr:reverse transcriptase domain-containing protein [Tanacetum cinerariifolium]
MRTRRSYFPITTNVTIPRRRQRKQNSNLVEPEFRTIVEMADNRTMAQMLQAPIEGYEDAIVVPPINANNFELKQTLINLVQSNQFTRRQDPHNHLRFFNKMQQTEIAELRETDRKRQAQMVETLRVMGDMRREMGDMQSELLALREEPRRAGQPRGDARVPNRQDAPRDADSHI